MILIVVLLLIAVNALFVLMEYALVRVRPSRIEMLARRGSGAALRVQEIQGRLDDYLAAIQLGITFIALAIGWIGEPTVAAWLRAHLSWASVYLSARAIFAVSFALALLVLSLVQS